LATFLTDCAPLPPTGKFLYCLCSYGFGKSESGITSLAFRSLISQLLRKDLGLLPHIYDNYVKVGNLPTINKIKELLQDVLQATDTVFIIIDGLDECDGSHQRQLLVDLDSIRRATDGNACKFLICSRETKEITARLKKCPQVSLADEQAAVAKDIESFVDDSLTPVRDRFSAQLVEELQQQIVRKADGGYHHVRSSLTIAYFCRRHVPLGTLSRRYAH
jgi:hypothetical protein